MGLKSIEMQVALPRTQDAGKLQDQLQRQNEHLQGMLANSRLQQEKIKRTQTQKMEESAKANLKKEKEETNNNRDEDKDNKSRKNKHPYLGKQIDFNG